MNDAIRLHQPGLYHKQQRQGKKQQGKRPAGREERAEKKVATSTRETEGLRTDKPGETARRLEKAAVFLEEYKEALEASRAPEGYKGRKMAEINEHVAACREGAAVCRGI